MKQLPYFLILIICATYGLSACGESGKTELSHDDSVNIYTAMKSGMEGTGGGEQQPMTAGAEYRTRPEACSTAKEWMRNYQTAHPDTTHSYLVNSSEITKLRLDLNPYMHVFYAQKTVGGPVTLVLTALKSDGRHYFFGANGDQVLEYVTPCSPCRDESGTVIEAPSTLACPD